MSDKSTRAQSRRKSPSSPLWLHASGQWAVKRRGKTYYFGTDHEKALAEYLRVKPDLEAGRPIRRAFKGAEGITVVEVCEIFLRSKATSVSLGDLTDRSFSDYRATCKELTAQLGRETLVSSISPSDFLRLRDSWAKRWGVHRLGSEIARTRVILNFAFNNDLIEKPVKFGEFKRPSKSAYRRRRAEVGPRLFTPEEIKSLLSIASPAMRGMILLGLNAGFGNNDCATLPIGAIDWENGWLEFPRPKTGIPRRVPLWPETLKALRFVRSQRKNKRALASNAPLFVTDKGEPWLCKRGERHNSLVSIAFRALLDKLAIHRPGRSFYCLRHVFQTVAETTGDGVAIKRVMGHADHSISDTYREAFPDDRLKRVTEAVRVWVFPPDEVSPETAPPKNVSPENVSPETVGGDV